MVSYKTHTDLTKEVKHGNKGNLAQPFLYPD